MMLFGCRWSQVQPWPPYMKQCTLGGRAKVRLRLPNDWLTVWTIKVWLIKLSNWQTNRWHVYGMMNWLTDWRTNWLCERYIRMTNQITIQVTYKWTSDWKYGRRSTGQYQWLNNYLKWLTVWLTGWHSLSQVNDDFKKSRNEWLTDWLDNSMNP